MNRFIVLAAALAGGAGCARTYDVTVDANGPIPVVSAPPRPAPAGQTVRVLVEDTVWGNRWTASVSDSALPKLSRTLVFMEGELGTLTRWFAPARTRAPLDTQNLIGDSQGDDPPITEVLRSLRASCTTPLGRDSVRLAAAAARREAENAVSAVRAGLATLEQPRYAAALAFALDARLHGFAHDLAASPLAGDLEHRLMDAASDGIHLTRSVFDSLRTELRTRNVSVSLDLDPGADDPEGEWIHLSRTTADALLRLTDPTLRALVARWVEGADEPEKSLSRREMDTFLSSSQAHVARIHALRAAVPADAPDEGGSLLAILEEMKEARERHAEVVKALADLASACPNAVPPGTTAMPGEPTVNGRKVEPLLTTNGIDRLRRVYADLVTVERDLGRMAAALNQLPYWTRHTGKDTIFARAFEGHRAATFQIHREPRYGTFVVAKPSEGKEKDDRDANTTGGRADDASAVSHRVEILPGYRFHVGAGLVRSSLRTREFETTADTVGGVTGTRIRQTDETPNQLFPAAFLSYNVLPLRGRSYDAREYQAWPDLRSLGLSVQVGVSLRDPTENVFFGATTELFPGLHFGFGHHLAYVNTTRHAPGAFVADTEGPAVEKRWRGEWSAWSLGVDANVFFQTLGRLFK